MLYTLCACSFSRTPSSEESVNSPLLLTWEMTAMESTQSRGRPCQQASKSFLRRLACFNEQGELPHFVGRKCELVVSEDHTITGFTDGGDGGGSMIQVNHGQCVSLEAEAIGRVLDIDFTGLLVPKGATAAVSAQVSKWMDPKQRGKPATRNSQGALISSFQSGFKEYVVRRRQELFLPGTDGEYISVSKAYCLKEELNGVKYNWAQDRADHITLGMRVAIRARRKPLSTNIKALLSRYILVALQLLKGLEDLQPPRNRRNVPKRQVESKPCLEELEGKRVKKEPTLEWRAEEAADGRSGLEQSLAETKLDAPVGEHKFSQGKSVQLLNLTGEESKHVEETVRERFTGFFYAVGCPLL